MHFEPGPYRYQARMHSPRHRRIGVGRASRPRSLDAGVGPSALPDVVDHSRWEEDPSRASTGHSSFTSWAGLELAAGQLGQRGGQREWPARLR